MKRHTFGDERMERFKEFRGFHWLSLGGLLGLCALSPQKMAVSTYRVELNRRLQEIVEL
jgi:hypothetical protein